MPKQYEHAIIEVEVKQRLEAMRDDLRFPSLSALLTYLMDNLLAHERKPQ